MGKPCNFLWGNLAFLMEKPYIKYHKQFYLDYLIQYLLLYKVIYFFAVLFFGVLFGDGRLLWFMCMLLGMLLGHACMYVSAWFCMYACM